MATKDSPHGKAIVVVPNSSPQQDTSAHVEVVVIGTAQLPPVPMANPLLGSFTRQTQHAPLLDELPLGIRVYPLSRTNSGPLRNVETA